LLNLRLSLRLCAADFRRTLFIHNEFKDDTSASHGCGQCRCRMRLNSCLPGAVVAPRTYLHKPGRCEVDHTHYRRHNRLGLNQPSNVWRLREYVIITARSDAGRGRRERYQACCEAAAVAHSLWAAIGHSGRFGASQRGSELEGPLGCLDEQRRVMAVVESRADSGWLRTTDSVEPLGTFCAHQIVNAQVDTQGASST
jgi:hypothetical protein